VTDRLDERRLSVGKALRLHRLFRHPSGRVFVLPLDHSVTDGPITGPEPLDRLVANVSAAGADAVVLHKGRIASIAPERWSNLALIVHLSASTRHASDPNAKVLVSSVEDALRLGADAIGVHVNIGSETESQQLRDLGSVARDCERWSIPLLAMMYPRGVHIKDPNDPELLAHVAAIAADLGADIVKTPYTGSPVTMHQVVQSCPIPLLVAGGPPMASIEELLRYVEQVVGSGAAGVALGRNVFTAADPAEVARRVSAMVHGGAPAPAGVVAGR
jgi:2-amino-4,5-dihydroxy-6-oxo-7-(phosphooxy)heptanoate synthase